MKVVFVDTGFWIARFIPNDNHHQRATEVTKALGAARLLTSEMVLNEFLAALSRASLRSTAVAAVRKIVANPNVEVVPQTSIQFREAFEFYAKHADKAWSLTDCASFKLMAERGVSEALAHDHHFEQAGFKALLRPGASPTSR